MVIEQLCDCVHVCVAVVIVVVILSHINGRSYHCVSV